MHMYIYKICVYIYVYIYTYKYTRLYLGLNDILLHHLPQRYLRRCFFQSAPHFPGDPSIAFTSKVPRSGPIQPDPGSRGQFINHGSQLTMYPSFWDDPPSRSIYYTILWVVPLPRMLARQPQG